jgi:tetratricopeptide (TPR) repeat protein
MLGDIEGARQLIEQSVARAVESDHVPELMNAYLFKAEHELRLGRAEAALRAAEILDDIHRNRQTENWGVMHAAWARARLSDRKIGIAELRRALADCAQENNNLAIPFFEGRLAELEAEEGDFEHALTRIDEALAFALETGVHMSDAFLHRIHGEILLKRDSINPAPAEEAFQTARAVAQQQGGAFTACRRRSPSPSSTCRPAAPPTPTRSSGRRSKALRRRGRCLRSLRRRRCYRDCRKSA